MISNFPSPLLYPVPRPRRWCGRLASVLTVFWVGLGASAQAGQSQPAAIESGVEALRVYLDCDRRSCDFDYLRQEITFVNYVRDRRDAQVHVLVTRERTAAGGQAFTLDFFGLEDFLGQDDQLMFTQWVPMIGIENHSDSISSSFWAFFLSARLRRLSRKGTMAMKNAAMAKPLLAKKSVFSGMKMMPPTMNTPAAIMARA